MSERPDCRRCLHFFVTWRPSHPRGCRAYGFEGTEWPHVTVERTTGLPCQGFEPRRTGTSDRPGGPRDGTAGDRLYG